MGARVYIPELGRFLQVDPVDGGCVNAYVYVLDPVNQRDLDGKFIWFAIALVSIALSVYNAVQDPTPLNITLAIVDIATAGIGSKVIAGLKIAKEVANVAVNAVKTTSNTAKAASRIENATGAVSAYKNTSGTYQFSTQASQTYSGMSTRSISSRLNSHISSGKLSPNAQVSINTTTGASRLEIRIAEQQLINESGGIADPYVANKINSIAEKFWDDLGL